MTYSDILPGYRVADDGAWVTLPWPDRPEDLPPSLGWGCIQWCETYLVNHLTGQPWRFTPGQKRFVVLWYAVTETGRWLYRSGVKRGAKGTGKDPLAGALGPCRFAGFDRAGNALGVQQPMALVQVAANSESQAKDVLRVANGMWSKRGISEYGVDSGIKRTILANGSQAEIITSSEASAEGDPATAIFLNESHHMTESNGGHAIAAVARRNVAKSPIDIGARLLELTNAHRSGSDSIGEQSYNAWQAQVSGLTKRVDILYDSVEADPSLSLLNDEDIELGLRQAYRDAPWADLERLRDEIYDVRTSEADAIRFYFNGLATAQDAWVDPRKFDDLGRPRELKRGERVALFLDCSKSDDSTALVGCAIEDGYVFTVGVWRKPKGNRQRYLVPRHEVDAKVRGVFADQTVVWFGVDPSPAVEDDDPEVEYWADLIDQWHRDFGKTLPVWAGKGQNHSVLFDMRMSKAGGAIRNQQFTEVAMRTARDIDEDAGFYHDGNPLLRQHVHNAKMRPNKWGITLSKASRMSEHKIDLAVAMVGARMGRVLYLNSGKAKRPRTGRMVGA
jgi:hypothetical protein